MSHVKTREVQSSAAQICSRKQWGVCVNKAKLELARMRNRETSLWSHSGRSFALLAVFIYFNKSKE